MRGVLGPTGGSALAFGCCPHPKLWVPASTVPWVLGSHLNFPKSLYFSFFFSVFSTHLCQNLAPGQRLAAGTTPSSLPYPAPVIPRPAGCRHFRNNSPVGVLGEGKARGRTFGEGWCLDPLGFGTVPLGFGGRRGARCPGVGGEVDVGGCGGAEMLREALPFSGKSPLLEQQT